MQKIDDRFDRSEEIDNLSTMLEFYLLTTVIYSLNELVEDIEIKFIVVQSLQTIPT